MASDLSLTLFETVDAEDGVVHLDTSDMRLLGVHAGDLVAVDGARRVYLTAQPSSVAERNQCMAQVSLLTAKNLGCLTGQRVHLQAERTRFPVAELIRLQAEDDLDRLHLLARRKQIAGIWNRHVVTIDDCVSLPTLDRNPLWAKVSDVLPHGAVQIGHATDFVIETPKADPSAVSIGGLRDTYRLCHGLVQTRYKNGVAAAARSVVLSGPMGCGKARLVARLARAHGVELHVLDAYHLLDKTIAGQPVDLTSFLTELGHRGRVILLLDHLAALGENKESHPSLMTARHSVIGQLCALLDDIPTQPNVMVFGVVSGAFSSQFRLYQRFDVHIPVDAPNRWGRHEVLLLATADKQLSEDVDLGAIADIARGMTPGNIVQMVRRAQILAGNEKLTNADLMQAFRSTEAFAEAEVHCDVPAASLDEIAGLEDIKRLMYETLSWTLFQYDKFALAGVRPPQSILLSGGQGTGKTSFVRALAGHMPLPFIEVICPSLVARPIDDAIRYMRACFAMAKRRAPCLLFFDDVDVLFEFETAQTADGARSQSSLVSLLISEMDALNSLLGVVVIAATNRPDRLSSEVLHPGRFDFVMTLPMPDQAARKKVLQLHARKLPLAADVDFDSLAAGTQGMSPAEIANLCNRVGLMALRFALNSPEMGGLLPVVTADLFEQVLRGRKN